MSFEKPFSGRLVLICLCLQAREEGVSQAAFFMAKVAGKSPKPELSDLCSDETIGDGRVLEKSPSVCTCLDKKRFPMAALGSTHDDLKWRMANGLGPEPLFVLRKRKGKWYAL